MTINVGDFNNPSTSFTDGIMGATMSPFTCSMAGSSHNAPSDVDGSLNRAINPFICNFTDGLLFPRIGCDLIGNRQHALVASPGPEIRAAMILCDYANVGLPRSGPWDGSSGTYITRQEYEDYILSSASNVQYLTYYTDVMENGPDSTAGSYYYSQTGPSGAGSFWDAQLNGKLKNDTLDFASQKQSGSCAESYQN